MHDGNLQDTFALIFSNNEYPNFSSQQKFGIEVISVKTWRNNKRI